MNALEKLLGPDADALLAELGIGKMPEQDKELVIAELADHFMDLITETTLHNLNDEQLKEFKLAMQLPSSERDEKITQITSGVLGLADKIHQAIENELKVIKSARAQLN